MKIRYAAALSGLTLLLAGVFTATALHMDLRVATALMTRQAWILKHPLFWSFAYWLWLFAVFGWMVLMVTLTWSYLPAHRVATMLQSGLMVIAAVLSIAALVVWMALASLVVGLDDAFGFLPIVDMLALGLAGAGLFMGGAVSAWIGWDLAHHGALGWSWGAGPMIAGVLAMPAPFVLPMPWLLVSAAFVWIGWCLFLVTRRALPRAFAEMI